VRCCHPFLVAAFAAVLVGAVPGPATAQLPDVELPEVEVPEVQVPGVEVPEVDVPDIPATEVPVPDLPVIDEPSVTTPEVKTPDVGTGVAPPAPHATPADRAAEKGDDTGAAAGPTGTSPARSVRLAADEVRDTARPRAEDDAGGDARLRDDGRRGDSPSERRVRRLVRAAGACLGGLPVAQRRVLALRAGIGARDPHSRRATAAALDLTVPEVRRRERAGLRQLRALAGDCGSTASNGGSADGSPLGQARTVGLAASRNAAGDDTSADGDRNQRERVGVLGQSDSTAAPDPVTPATLFTGGMPGEDAGPWVYILASLAVVLTALLANRRSRHWILHPD